MTVLDPAVHVVVLNYNGWRDTVECLDSLARLDYPAVRIVVCDNGSSDDSVARLLDWAHAHDVSSVTLTRSQAEAGPIVAGGDRLVLIRNGANLGFTAGNNVALRFVMATSSDGYVWVLNNDVVVAPDSLRRLVAVAESDEQIGAVGGTLYEHHDPDLVQEAGGGRTHGALGMVRIRDAGARRGASLGAGPMDYVSGACLLTRRSILDSVGLMDERFFIYSDDVDWCLRMRQHGYTLAYCAEADIRHKASATMGTRSTFKDYHIVRSAFLFAEKHARMGLRAHLEGVYRFVLPKLVRGEWARLGAVVRGYRAYRRDVPRADSRQRAGA